MAFNTKSIIKDVNQKPVPQYYNPATDVYEVLQGANGANRVTLYTSTGAEVDLSVLIGAIKTALEGINNKDSTKTIYDLSTVTKPTTGLNKGDKFFEIDTGEVYMWNGSAWVVI